MTDRYQPTRRRLLRDLGGAGVGLAGAGLVACCRRGAGRSGRRDPLLHAHARAHRGPLLPRPRQGQARRDRGQARPAARPAHQGRQRAHLQAARATWPSRSGTPTRAGPTPASPRRAPRARPTCAACRSRGEGASPCSARSIPGWYQGRAIHIHLKVHVGGRHRAHRAALLRRVGQRPGGSAVALQPPPAARGCATATTTSTGRRAPARWCACGGARPTASARA